VKKYLVTALAGIAAVVALAGCGSSAPQPSASGCKTALAAQLAASENGSQAAKNAPLPQPCNGLSPSVVSSIAAQVIESGLSASLKEDGR